VFTDGKEKKGATPRHNQPERCYGLGTSLNPNDSEFLKKNDFYCHPLKRGFFHSLMAGILVRNRSESFGIVVLRTPVVVHDNAFGTAGEWKPRKVERCTTEERRSSNRQGCWTSKQSLDCLAYLAAMFIGWRIVGECPDR
jgi:hypothetical protein